ncbi:unnamed protein product [Schistosoma mattheei]|uniref:Uncharacterized protein n=1 Tax=Schistosoma mattheei TaxID=31246 RepID=A0AA85ATL7_9TREM|nr:unnamed protein product [Schistosoma mattheei]
MLGTRLVSNLVVMVASGSLAQRGFVLRLQRFWSASYERPLQILDTNHSGVACQLKQQIQHIAPGTVLRKRPSLATRRSTIAFLFANSSVLQSLVSRSVPRFKPLFIESVNPF